MQLSISADDALSPAGAKMTVLQDSLTYLAYFIKCQSDFGKMTVLHSLFLAKVQLLLEKRVN